MVIRVNSFRYRITCSNCTLYFLTLRRLPAQKCSSHMLACIQTAPRSVLDMFFFLAHSDSKDVFAFSYLLNPCSASALMAKPSHTNHNFHWWRSQISWSLCNFCYFSVRVISSKGIVYSVHYLICYFYSSFLRLINLITSPLLGNFPFAVYCTSLFSERTSSAWIWAHIF